MPRASHWIHKKQNVLHSHHTLTPDDVVSLMFEIYSSIDSFSKVFIDDTLIFAFAKLLYYDTNYLSRFYLYDMIRVECMRKLKLGNQGVIYYAR